MKRLAILPVFFALLTVSAFALGLRVYPLIVKLSGTAGQQKNFTLLLADNADVQIAANLRIKDFFVGPNGTYNMSQYASYTHSCAPWISTPSTDILISPQESVNVPFTVKIPSNAAGQYFAVIPVNYMPPHQKGIFRIAMNIDVIVILDITDSPHTYNVHFKSVKLYNTKLDKLPKDFPSSLKSYPYVFKLDYENLGNVVVGLQGQFRVISDTLHKLVGNVELNRQKTICFPAITRTIWIPFERLMPNGDYRAILSADLGDHHMVSYVFKFKVTGAKTGRSPALKLDTPEIDIPLERLNTYLGKNFKIESLDYRMINVKTTLTGMIQTKAGTLISAPLDKEIFDYFRVYPSRFTLYPYSEREVRIAGRAPLKMPTAGQYYALLKMVASVKDGKEPKILEIPVILSVGKLTKELELDNLSCSKVGTATKVSIDIVNYGNSYVDYSGQVFVTNEKGRTMLAQPAVIKKSRIYAGFTLSPTVMLPLEVKKGYTVRVVVKYLVGKTTNGAPIYKTISKTLIVQ